MVVVGIDVGGTFTDLTAVDEASGRVVVTKVPSQPRNEAEQWLVSTVQRQAQKAGIGMPEVAVYDAPEINAFATGANRNHALVAVSTGFSNGRPSLRLAVHSRLSC